MEKEKVQGNDYRRRPPSIRVVGIGPGDASLLTPQAREALQEAEVVVGYGLYLSQVEFLLEGKETFTSGMKKEIDRAQKAIDLAREGKRVAVVSGGDPGVYGMAGLILEILEPHELTVEVVPGITAASAAASLLGAPLMHDFSVISLSDLLTPWEVIEKRLKAAGEGDFILVIYNPASKKRRWQVERAREILLSYREKQTPVGIVRNSFRDNQEIVICELETMLDYTIDMFTTLIIGSSQTYRRGDYMITPRGYKIPVK